MSVVSKKIGQFWSDLFPIKRNEILMFICFCLLFNFLILEYSLVRVTKDSLVQTYIQLGSKSPLPILKAVFVPMATAISAIFTSFLFKRFKQSTVFYVLVAYFISFFGLYGFVLYPNMKSLSIPVGSLLVNAPWLESVWLSLSSWMHVLFYVKAELFGVLIVGLFWNFANQTLSRNESKRFYPAFLISVQVSVFLSGTIQKVLASDAIAAASRINIFSSVCMIIGILSIITFFILNKFLIGPERVQASDVSVHAERKPKVSITQSLKALFSSPRVWLISAIVICYGICNNIIDVEFKSTLIKFLKAQNFSNELLVWEQTKYLGTLLQVQAVVSAIIGICGSTMMRSVRWIILAMITPTVILIGSILFLGVDTSIGQYLIKGICKIIFPSIDIMSTAGNLNINWIIMLIGASIVIFGRSTKYLLFDLSKEIAVRELPKDEQIDSKMAESFSSRLGKAGGSWVRLTLEFLGSIFGFGSKFALFLTVLVTAGAWTVANMAIAKLSFKKSEEKK